MGEVLNDMGRGKSAALLKKSLLPFMLKTTILSTGLSSRFDKNPAFPEVPAHFGSFLKYQ